jgi:hypothetical protein
VSLCSLSPSFWYYSTYKVTCQRACILLPTSLVQVCIPTTYGTGVSTARVLNLRGILNCFAGEEGRMDKFTKLPDGSMEVCRDKSALAGVAQLRSALSVLIDGVFS